MLVLNHRFYKAKTILIFAFLLFVALPVILQNYVIFRTVDQELTENIAERMAYSVEKSLQNITNLINKMDYYLQDLASDPAVIALLSGDTLSSLDGNLHSAVMAVDAVVHSKFLLEMDILDNVIITVGEGTHYSFRERVYLEQDELPMARWYQDTMNAKGRIYFIGVVPKESYLSEGETIFAAARQIIPSGKMERGVIYLSYKSQALDASLLESAPDEFVFVADSSGRLLLSTPGYDALPDVLLRFGETGDLSVKTVDLAGHTYLLAISEQNSYGWRIYQLVSLESVMETVNRVRLPILIGTLVCVFVFAVFLTFIYLNITGPMQKLVNYLNAINDHKYGDDDYVRRCYELLKIRSSVITLVEQGTESRERLVKADRMNQKLEHDVRLAQINPHFIYNTLNHVRFTAMRNNQPEIESILASFTKLLSNAIHRNGEFTTVAGELDNLRCYIEIFRATSGFEAEVTIDCEPAAEEVSIPVMILQPLVENVFLHAFPDRNENAVVLIRIRIANGFLNISVTDNGVGMSDENLAAFYERKKNAGLSGVGMNNVRDRLNAIYHAADSMNVGKNPSGGTVVRLSIPLADENQTTEVTC